MFMPLAPKRFRNFVRVLHFNEGNGPTIDELTRLATERGYRIEIKEQGYGNNNFDDT
jgi:hypothetical protein